jgi:FMN phosphatase YigB (HAD superfamily)
MKTIFFDWGRTLWEPETKTLHPDVHDILSYLKDRGYRLFVVSLVITSTVEERRTALKENGLEKYFDGVYFTQSDKEALYEKACSENAVLPQDLTVVDDRVIRGIRWGNKFGATTVWFQNGKFKNELPTTETGNPTFTVHSLSELKKIL